MPATDFEAILADSSRALADYTAAMVAHEPDLYRQLMELAYQQKKQVSMRAARVADICSERHPEMVRPYLEEMVKRLPDLRDMAVKRVFMHILTRHSWVENEEAMGRLVDTLMRWMTDDSQDISIQAYSIVILENITKVVPDLRFELMAVLEEALPVWESPGMQSIGRKILKRLRKLKDQHDQIT